MMKKALLASAVISALLVFPMTGMAKKYVPQNEQLVAPNKTGGKPLMQALAERQSNRKFSDKAISDQTLSDLLWATWGINRDDGHRTAPTAHNKQQVIVYVVKNNGVWRYDAKTHSLIEESKQDYTKDFSGIFSSVPPLSFVYAAPSGENDAMHIGALFQNAGLYSASVGLNNVVRGQYNDVLSNKISLEKGYKIHISQSFGWPK